MGSSDWQPQSPDQSSPCVLIKDCCQRMEHSSGRATLASRSPRSKLTGLSKIYFKDRLLSFYSRLCKGVQRERMIMFLANKIVEDPRNTKEIQ
jgi:hypothetical protein